MTNGKTPAPRFDEARCELIFRSERTRVYRMPDDEGHTRYVYKKFLGPNAAERRRHEEYVLETLSEVDGVPRLIELKTQDKLHAGQATLTTVDADPLRTRQLSLAQLLDFAPKLARVLAAVHQRGVIHRDINPSNILIRRQQGEPVLIDFELATLRSENPPSFAHPRDIAGTLAYLPPEQTGRTARTIDQRSDLYAVGATLYELATGRPPFDLEDPLQLIRSHMARKPVPPNQLVPALPATLSAIILKLLEKEPDRRYQSAEGLALDLERLRDALHAGDHDPQFELGGRDFPARLIPPSRPVGRDREIETLERALAQSIEGRCHFVLVSGPSGVGKTALVNELRTRVAAANGWFVAGKFDQFRNQTGPSAGLQILRDLSNLLLTENETELSGELRRIFQNLGPGIVRATEVLPELAEALQNQPKAAAGQMSEAQFRVRRAGYDLVRAIARPERPLIIFADDLQWADQVFLNGLDDMFSRSQPRGLLLIGAYRDSEVHPNHPLHSLIQRWQTQAHPPWRIALSNLKPEALQDLVQGVLRIDAQAAQPLAAALYERASGNPYDTLELLNALRDDGTLHAGANGWHCDAEAIRRHIGQHEVLQLLRDRVQRLPAGTQALLDILSMIGTSLRLPTLALAAGGTLDTLRTDMHPAVEDGLLRVQREEVAFAHDRVQKVVLEHLESEARNQLHLQIARRLAPDPLQLDLAAQQYLPVSNALSDPGELRRVIALFQTAAQRARSVAVYKIAEQYTRTALRLIDTLGDDDAAQQSAALQLELHATLFYLGKLDLADDTYAAIEASSAHIADGQLLLAEAGALQVRSLTNRGRIAKALDLGIGLLRRLGLHIPEDSDEAEFARRYERLCRWATLPDLEQERCRPTITDRRLLAIAALANSSVPPAFFCDRQAFAWIIFECQRLWETHGPCASLVGVLPHAAALTIALQQDYRTGNEIAKRVIRISLDKGYEPETSQARFLAALGMGHWFVPLEDNISEAMNVREGLLRGGDMQNAGFSFYVTISQLIDCCSTLSVFSEELESGLGLTAQTGNQQAHGAFIAYRQLTRSLRGLTRAPGSLDDDEFQEAEHLDRLGADPTACAHAHLASAQAAMLFGDLPQWLAHSEAAQRIQPFQVAYSTVRARWMHALALCAHLREGDEPDEARLRQIDEYRDWFAQRAEDCPENFNVLLRHIDAERAWTLQRPWEATQHFDAALRAADRRPGVGLRALVAERAGLFCLEAGLIRSGRTLLRAALECYRYWGASAKVKDLLQRYPYLRHSAAQQAAESRGANSTLSSDSLDLHAILRASQALSSETHLPRLRARVVDLLGALTGATNVSLILRDQESEQWLLTGTGDSDTEAVGVDEAARRGQLPLTAFRYAERKNETLLVEDATGDSRFSMDPYFSTMERCSLLIVPISSKGQPRAMLLLENRLVRGAFSADRLDAVMLIAGQLAVSLDNALLYDSLERIVAERTRELETANQRLEALSLTDPLTGLANRRRFADVLEREWLRAGRTNTPVGIAMIDVDHFKHYNDRYGHLAGDACLQRVSAALGGSVREGMDLAARYGGEEFALIFSGADASTAEALAERALKAIHDLAEPHEGCAPGIVTVSIGVSAKVPAPEDAVEQLLETADKALYLAKGAGRDRVCRL